MLIVLLPLLIQQSRFFLALCHVICTIIGLCCLSSTTPCPFDFKLVDRIARAEVFRLGSGDPGRDEVGRASAGRCAILVDQAPVAGVVVHFHEFDDALRGICEAFLALHDALELLRLDLERLAGKFIIRLCSIFLVFLTERSAWGLAKFFGQGPLVRNLLCLGVYVVSSMLAQQTVRCLERRIGHPSMSSVLWELNFAVVVRLRRAGGFTIRSHLRVSL